MIRLRIILFLSVIFSLPSWVFASQVVLKTGQKIEGNIIEKTDKYIKIDTGLDVPLTYYIEEIETLDGQALNLVIESKATQGAGVDNAATISQEAQGAGTNKVTVEGKSLDIVDSFAALSNFFEKQKLVVYFFSQPITAEQKENLVKQAVVSAGLIKLPENPPIFKIEIIFKKDSQECSSKMVERSEISFLKSSLSRPDTLMGSVISTSGLYSLICSFNQNANVNIGFKNETSKDVFLPPSNQLVSPSSWDINMSTKILAVEQGIVDVDKINEDSSLAEDGKPTVKEIRPALKKFLEQRDGKNCSTEPVIKFSIYKIGSYDQSLGGWPIFSTNQMECVSTDKIKTSTSNVDVSGTAFTAIARKVTSGEYECFTPEIFKDAEKEMKEKLQDVFGKIKL